jgi:prevent-host-death family protein
MTEMTITEAKVRISQLREAVENGEEIVISRNGEPFARLVAHPKHRRRTGRGILKGQIDMSRFDEADEEIAREFGMLD